MRSEFKNGKGSLVMVKADASICQQAKYLLNFMAKNLAEDDTDQQGIRNASATLQKLCERFGAKYLDEKGQLVESSRRAAVDDGVPS